MFLVEVTTLSEEGVTVGPEGPVYIQVRKGGTVGPKGSFTNGKERGHSASQGYFLHMVREGHSWS